MVSPIVNVLRWSALGGGIVYGFLHNRTLYKTKVAHDKQEEYNHKVELIEKAKAEYRRSKEVSGVVTNPDDPRFDMEKFLLHLEKTSA